MTYVKTQLKREITIPAIVTIHYFEYMKDFAFKGESHDFWEFLYVDKGNILVRAADDFAESGAVFADAAQGAGRKGGRFQTV